MRIAAADFYIPIAPPLPHEIFAQSYKIPYANYTRTDRFCLCNILHFCGFGTHKIRLFCCRRKCLYGVGQPIFSVSGRKRYNILDFAKPIHSIGLFKIVCQMGASPLWKPRRDCFSLAISQPKLSV